MKIWRIASPLPLNTKPIEYGEKQVSTLLGEYDIWDLDEKYRFKSHLGGGMWGAAFSTFDDKVVKITTDRGEYAAALELKDRKWGDTTFVTIYEAYQLNENQNIFVIVKDLVTPLSSEEKDLFDAFVNNFNSDVDAVTDEYSDKIPLFNEFSEYIDDVQNYTQFEDTFNPDNIGRNSDGQIVAFDPRQSSFK